MSQRGPKILAITSGKGGVGKTTFTVNLGLRLSDMGKNVLILDGDFGLGNVAISLGLEPEFGLEDVFFGERRINDICMVGPGGIKVLPAANSSTRMASLDPARMDRFIRELQFFAASEDYVLVDTGAGVGRNVINLLSMSHHVLVLTTPEPTSMADAYGVIKTCCEIRPDLRLELVINRCKSTLEAKAVENKLKLASRRFLKRDLVLCGFIEQSLEIHHLSREQKVLLLEASQSVAAQQVRRIAHRLEGVELAEDKANFVERFMDFIQ